MKGFILAAGFGQRMAPVTEVLPKPMLTVGRYPLIAYAIHLLKSADITDIMVNTHHLPEVIEQSLGDGSRYGVRLYYSREPEILGTGGGLKRAHPFLDETFVVVNSDILIDHDLPRAIAEHKQRQAIATMVLRDPEPSRQELAVIETDATERVVRLYQEGAPPPGAVLPLRSRMFTGVHVIEPKFLDYIPNNVHTSVVQYGYAKALANNERVFASHCAGYWIDAGTPNDYLEVNRSALEGTLQLRYMDPMGGYKLSPKKDLGHAIRMGEDVHLGPNARLERPAALDDGCQIGDKATVGPWTVIGKQASIGKEAKVTHSVVLPGASVGAGQSVTRAIVAKHARLHVPDAEPKPEPS